MYVNLLTKKKTAINKFKNLTKLKCILLIYIYIALYIEGTMLRIASVLIINDVTFYLGYIKFIYGK